MSRWGVMEWLWRELASSQAQPTTWLQVKTEFVQPSSRKWHGKMNLNKVWACCISQFWVWDATAYFFTLGWPDLRWVCCLADSCVHCTTNSVQEFGCWAIHPHQVSCLLFHTESGGVFVVRNITQHHFLSLIVEAWRFPQLSAKKNLCPILNQYLLFGKFSSSWTSGGLFVHFHQGLWVSTVQKGKWEPQFLWELQKKTLSRSKEHTPRLTLRMPHLYHHPIKCIKQHPLVQSSVKTEW